VHVKKTNPPGQPPTRPRLKKETLRGLGFEDLAAVHGGRPIKRPCLSRYCPGD
jgi:hypothetical protein